MEDEMKNHSFVALAAAAATVVSCLSSAGQVVFAAPKQQAQQTTQTTQANRSGMMVPLQSELDAGGDTREWTGFGRWRWGMNSKEVSNIEFLPPGKKEAIGMRAVPTKIRHAKSFVLEGLELFTNSPRRYVLQLWLVNDRLTELEVRPLQQTESPDFVGNTDGEGYRNELMTYCVGIWPGWEKAARELRASSVQAKYKYTAPVGTINAVVPRAGQMVNSPIYGPVYVMPSAEYVPTTIYGTREAITDQPLGYTITEDSWWSKHTDDTKSQWRLAWLNGGKPADNPDSAAINIVRLQAHQGNDPFQFGTRRVQKLNDTKANRKDIAENYNVHPGESR